MGECGAKSVRAEHSILKRRMLDAVPIDIPQDEHDPAVLRVQGFEPAYSAEGAWLADAALPF